MIRKLFLTAFILLFVEVVNAQSEDEVVIKVNGAICEIIRVGTPCVIEVSVQGNFSGGSIITGFSIPSTTLFKRESNVILSEDAIFESGDNTTKRVTATAVPLKNICEESISNCDGGLGFFIGFISTDEIYTDLIREQSLAPIRYRIELSHPEEAYDYNRRVKVLQPLCPDSGEDLINGPAYSTSMLQNGFNLLCKFKELNIKERFEEPYVHNVYDRFDPSENHGERVLRREQVITDNLNISPPIGSELGSTTNRAERLVEAKDSILSVSVATPFRTTQFCTTERAQELVGDGIFITSGGNMTGVPRTHTDQANAFNSPGCINFPGAVFKEGEIIHDTTTKTAVIMVVGTVRETSQRHTGSAYCGLYGNTGMCIGSSYNGGTSFSAPRVATYLRIITHLFGINVETAWRGMKACAKKGDPFEIGIGAVDMGCFSGIETGSFTEFSELTGVPLDQVVPVKGRVEETMISIVYSSILFTDLNETSLLVKVTGVFRDRLGRSLPLSEQSIQVIREDGTVETRRLSEGLNIAEGERGRIVIKTITNFITTATVVITTPTYIATSDVLRIRGSLINSIFFIQRNIVQNSDIRNDMESNIIERLRETKIQETFDVTGDNRLDQIDTRSMIRFMSGVSVPNKEKIKNLLNN